MRHLLAGSTLGLFLACTADPAPRTDVEVADSAGIRVVTNLSVDPPRWSLDPEPIVDLGSVDGDGPDQFFRIGSARRRDDGSIAVFDSGSGEVRVFDDGGEHLRSFGGLGEGPGEFQGPGRLFLIGGDSLAVWDTRLRRLSIFDADGNLGRTVSPRGIERRPQIMTVLADGSTLFQQEIVVRGGTASYEPRFANYILFGPSGEVLDSLPVQPTVEVGLWGDTPLAGPRIFDEGTRFAGDSRGYWIGTTKTEEVVRYSLAGDIEMRVRWPAEDRAVGPDDAELWIRQQVGDRTPEEAASEIEMHGSRQVAEFYPSHGALIVDWVGALWMQAFARPGDDGAAPWRVFNRAGELIATVDMPHAHRVLDIGEDYVLAVGSDDLDIEHVRLFELIRRAN